MRVGKMIKGGSGMCDLMLDMEKLQNSEYIEDLDVKYQHTFKELTTDNTIRDIVEHGDEETNVFIPE